MGGATSLEVTGSGVARRANRWGMWKKSWQSCRGGGLFWGWNLAGEVEQEMKPSFENDRVIYFILGSI